MTQPAVAGKTRYAILAAVFVNVVINYMDRSNISVAGTFISKELQLDAVQMGYVFAAFGWTYATLQIPGGILADKVGIRLLYAVSLVGWSLATISLGFAPGFTVLICFRLLIGLFEAPAYPMNNRIVTAWFPVQERASAIAMYTSGQFIGLAFLAPVLTYVQNEVGWRGLFFITGSIGVVWGIAWYFIYRSPTAHKKISPEELEYIEQGGGLFNRNEQVAAGNKQFSFTDFHTVLSSKKLWGIYIAQFCLGGTMLFFLTWFPKYLVDYRRMDFIKSGWYASIPFICAFAGILFAGFLSDYLTKRGVSAGIARKAPIISGMLLSSAIIGANYVTSPGYVIFFMSLSFFGNGLASITWVLVSLLSPKHLIGLTGGVFNFIGGMSQVAVPIIIGYLVKGGDFSPALIFISLMALTGALCYVFLVGKIERIDDAQS